MKLLATILVIAGILLLVFVGWMIFQRQAPSNTAVTPDETVFPQFPEEGTSGTAEQTEEEKTITEAFTRNMPDGTRFSVPTIATSGEYALAVFMDENVGGTALLYREGGEWHLVATDGGLFNIDLLISHGVPEDIARYLVTTVE